MESPKCSFASCEHEVVGTAQIVGLSLSESEVLQFRYDIDMEYLCGVVRGQKISKTVKNSLNVKNLILSKKVKYIN